MELSPAQQIILSKIAQEVEYQKESYPVPKKYLSRLRTGVYYQPISGKFLFDDMYVSHETIIPLLDNKILLFKGFETHQGERMVRYELSKL